MAVPGMLRRISRRQSGSGGALVAAKAAPAAH